jgi:hypothetical protein
MKRIPNDGREASQLRHVSKEPSSKVDACPCFFSKAGASNSQDTYSICGRTLCSAMWTEFAQQEAKKIASIKKVSSDKDGKTEQ